MVSVVAELVIMRPRYSELGNKMIYASQFEAAGAQWHWPDHPPPPMMIVAWCPGVCSSSCSCPDLGVLQQQPAVLQMRGSALCLATVRIPACSQPREREREIRYFKVG